MCYGMDAVTRTVQGGAMRLIGRQMILKVCEKTCLCVDCDSKDCSFAGDLEADCPAWRCPYPGTKCEDCVMLRKSVENWRRDHGAT